MKSREHLDEVAAAILGEAIFQRSPVLSRLLLYLVERSGNGERAKAFEIATEGLGKGGTDSGEADTYARVVVTRLRRALAVYHSDHPDRDYIVIDPGSYFAKVVPAQVPAEETSPVALPGRSNLAVRRRRILGFCAIGLAMAVTLALLLLPSPKAWSNRDLSTLYVEKWNPQQGPADMQPRLTAIRQDLVENLNTYVGLRLVDKPAADFQLFLERLPLGGSGIQLTLIATKNRRIILSRQVPLPSPSNSMSLSQNLAFSIASPSGSLHAFARRSGYDLQSPYGCWLRFTEGVQTYNTLGDTMLETCAQQFYKHSSGRPLAAFLYAWTLTDQAIVDPTQAAREEKIRSALAVLHRSQSLNPDFTVLDIGEMRAHSIAGNRDAALRSARAALSEAQGNRVVTGMAATGLVLQGDNEGSAVLRRLENSGGPSPPWEQVGLFVAAMMADDSNEADRHMAELAKFESGQPLLLLLKAANARRAGRRDEADRALKELRSNLPIRIGGIEALLNRLPASAEVRQRLATWLKSDPDARNHRAIPVTQPKAPFP